MLTWPLHCPPHALQRNAVSRTVVCLEAHSARLRTEITGTRYNRTRSELDWIAYKIAASMKREPLVKRAGPCWDYT
jgi:hypothetical protein